MFIKFNTCTIKRVKDVNRFRKELYYKQIKT
jgi:hypothetical protein